MGYTPVRKTYQLVFDDTEYAGLEVVAHAGTVGQYLDIAKLADADLTPPYTDAMLDPVRELFKSFCSVLVSWNVEQPAGVPVEASPEGLMSLELMFAMAIIRAWMNAVAGVALPLDGGDLEASLPMDVLG